MAGVCGSAHGTRLCAHALNPTMHRASAANTATLNTASIMLPSTESRSPFEVLICRRPEIFLAILIVGLEPTGKGRISSAL
jgi:hypothetical protein